ncbi:NAD(P)/FAD-dependent oxidoreductase [Ostreiculturibacter nitratireducens]|uniref:NAD(P)/FAD-dependent oxidoreductase n=1 Tax=Ostreiculturibacter nitratireducens TaxID=3075226 RepID=UPI003CCC5993
MIDTRVLIVGAGQAGCSVAARLRALGHMGPITLIGEEPHPPYQRPPLSKAYLLGEMPRERLFLRPQTFYADQNIDLKLGASVDWIDRDENTVTVEDDTLPYDHLVLATGATPRRLPAAIGGDLPGTHVLRGIADIDRIAPEFEPGRRLVVVGGGYIGLEIAAVAAKRELNVTIIEAAPRILGRVAALETAAFFRDLHRDHGVRILEDTQLDRVTGTDRADGVLLSDGRHIAADFVVFGVGVAPNTRLAECAGLAVENGIWTDAYGRTSDPAIWAAGDCASLPFLGKRVRLESVGNAIDQGEAVAANILGAAEEYRPKPWFWSDQYDTKLQIAGLNAGSDTVVVRNAGAGSASIWYYRDAQLVAVDAINDPRAYMIGRRMIEAGTSPAPAEIAANDLKSLLIQSARHETTVAVGVAGQSAQATANNGG